MPGINPGMTGLWAAARPSKKWGTIFKKGAPHFPIFPVVEPFSEGQSLPPDGDCRDLGLGGRP